MKKIYTLFLLITGLFANAQEKNDDYYAAPVHVPMFLAGNFGELRSNHFHSGIDIKTQGHTGLPVFAVADGFISRINISPYGFGNALYIDHPNGTTTLYGHLESFSDKIQKYIRAIQYRKESFSVDVSVPPGELPVRNGEQIALSGNSGSSGGPHLHFEIRDTKTQHPLNPLKYHFKIKDGISPKILSVLIYPVSDEAAVAGTCFKQRYETVSDGRIYHILNNPVVPVCGTIGFGVQSVDYLDGSGNKCGIYSLGLRVDNKLVYSFRMDEFGFDESRYVNSLIDYDQKIRSGRNAYKTWIDPGNKLSVYDRSQGSGLYDFSDEKMHEIRYEIADVYGNTSILIFNVVSKKQSIQRENVASGIPFRYNKENIFKADGIEADFPDGCFYCDFNFEYNHFPAFPGIYSDVYEVHNKYTPVHKFFSIKIETQNLPERLVNKALLAYVNPKTGRVLSSLGGEYRNGWVEAEIRGFGDVAVAVDTIAPSIIPLSLKDGTLTESDQIRFKIRDNFSGISDFRGTIDAKWVLFEYDAKNNLITYKFDRERFDFGKKHELILNVTDAKGNRSVFKSGFYK